MTQYYDLWHGSPVRFQSRKGYIIRYEVILAISINIMVIEMLSFERR